MVIYKERGKSLFLMGGSREAAAFHIQLKVAVDHFLYRMSFQKKTTLFHFF